MPSIQLPRNAFEPGVFAVEIRDAAGSPSLVLDAGRPFTVDTRWRIDPAAALVLGGQWDVVVYLEPVGPEPVVVGATESVPVIGSTRYGATLTVPAGRIRPGGAAALYRIVTVLTHRNFGRTGAVAAVEEHSVLCVQRTVPRTPGTHRVEGRVVAPPSRPSLPVAGLVVHARLTNGATVDAGTDDHGRFGISGLPDGRIDLDLRTDVGPLTYISTASVRVDGDVRVVLRPLALADALDGTPEFETSWAK